MFIHGMYTELHNLAVTLEGLWS